MFVVTVHTAISCGAPALVERRERHTESGARALAFALREKYPAHAYTVTTQEEE